VDANEELACGDHAEWSVLLSHEHNLHVSTIGTDDMCVSPFLGWGGTAAVVMMTTRYDDDDVPVVVVRTALLLLPKYEYGWDNYF
jgi:hypothetical protein